MAHILRKYISNRGSALFMVISTMTALIISCMAMYFSMVSARSSQYAVFSQMQATQTAKSISEIIQYSMTDANSTGLREKMNELNKGESFTTGANGFLSLDPNVETGMDADQIGAYSVTITCIDDDGAGTKTFDILVMSVVSGSRDAFHFTMSSGGSEDPDEMEGADGAGGDAELFAATGYIPNDAYINGGYYLTNVFYDTQFTYMNTYGGSGENRIALDLYTGGDLMLGRDAMTVVHSASNDSIKPEDVAKIGPVTWAIRGNFYPNLGSDFGMRGGSQILVGGNFTFDSGNNSFYVKNDNYTGNAELGDHISVYVNGDLNYSGADIKSNVWFFVNGKITGIGQNKQSNARLFVTENADTSELHTNMDIEEWPLDGDFEYGLNYNEAMKLLGQKTQTIAYYKWDLSGETKKPETKHVDVRINASNSDYTDADGNVIEANSRNFVFAFDDGKGNVAESASLIRSEGGNENGVKGQSFIIDSVETNGDGNNGQNIIIDTGDDPNNIMTIKLNDVTGTGVFSWFVEREVKRVISWWPYEVEYGDPSTSLGNINGHKRLVLLKGRGTVLFDLPQGVTYQDAGYQVTAHVGWFLIEGGQIGEKDGHLEFSGLDAQGKYAAEIVPYIHKNCNGIYDGDEEGEFNDDCVFTKSDSEVKCNECGGFQTQITCSIHGDVNTYCSVCHPEKSSRTDWCINHVDKAKFKDFYDDELSGTEKDWVTGEDGEIVYPTTNIMLVSCDESAEMRFSQTLDNQGINNNEFFGFIYAPYVSYLAGGGAQAGGLIKLCGGMTVGDYDIQAIHAYIGCYPDKMPNELAGLAGGGTMAGGKLPGTTKSWKVEIGGYY